MEIGYKRSMGCNYMILQDGEINNEDSYQMHIFLDSDNQIPGLLPCRIQRVNGESLFYYEITGCQSLVHLFEKNKFCRQDLEDLFLAAVKMIETLDEYLLERNRLLLNPSYVYRDMENGKYLFAWFPGFKKTIEDEFRNLTEYILPKINHEDKAAVTIGYGVYRESTEDYLDTAAVRRKIFSGKEVQTEKRNGFWNQECTEEEERKIENQRQKILDDFYGDEAEEQSSYLPIFGVVFSVVLLAGMYLFRRNIYILSACAVFLSVGALGTGIWYVLKRRKTDASDREKSKVQEAYQGEGIDAEYGEVSGQLINKRTDMDGGTTTVLKENINAGAYLKCEDRVYPIDKDIIWIGKRKESVDIWLDVPTVSRIHAKIIHKKEGDYLMDLNSRNGTLINGEYLNPEEQYLLGNGCSIVFAQVRFLYFSSN